MFAGLLLVSGPAYGDRIRTMPINFCKYGSYNEWTSFNADGIDYNIPTQYSPDDFLLRRYSTRIVGYSAYINVKNFTPSRDLDNKKIVDLSEEGSLVLTKIDDINIVLKRFIESFFPNEEFNALNSNIETMKFNGLFQVKPKSKQNNYDLYYNKNDGENISDIIYCKKYSSSVEETPKNGDCTFAMGGKYRSYMYFSSKSLNDWRSIRQKIIDFIECGRSTKLR